jgi:hypothetical protein
MRSMLAMLAVVMSLAHPVEAQTADGVSLSVGGFKLAENGPESAAGVWRGTGPIVIGAPTVGVFSVHGCGAFSVTVPPHGFAENATAGWRVEITPTRVVDHAVTFRLRWVRALDKSGALPPASEDVEVTLRPGESRPLDLVPIDRAGATTIDGRPCRTKAVSLRVVADFPVFDRRLIGLDVWLVERLANGKEQSQRQSLRGVPHRPIPFYFDGVADGTKRIDIFGKLVVEPENGGIKVALETVRGEAHAGQQGYQAARWFRSTVRVDPDEIVEIALREPDEKTTASSSGTFSIRITAKQIR